MVSQAREDFALLKQASFRPWQDGEPDDPMWDQWLDGGGVYATNGALVGIIHRSRPELPDPDLFIFGLPADFRGYAPGYSQTLEQSRDRFTWAILKAHTGNTGGTVRLRSADPRDTPQVSFRYFAEAVDDGTPGSQGDIDHDLDDVVRGVELVRDLNRRAGWVVERELHPGPDVASREQLRRFVADEAWGHHASCTARIGRADDPLAVVGSDFAVHGVPGLRVVDASVFPRIPGLLHRDADLHGQREGERRADRRRPPPHLRRPCDRQRRDPDERTGTRMSSSYRQGLFWRVLVFVSEQVDHRKHWDKLPLAPALAVLVGVRTKLRQQNLYDTGGLPSTDVPSAPPYDAKHRTQRTSDGSYNDLAVPDDGHGRDAVRPQRAAREHPAGHGRRRARDPQPAGGQPAADDAARAQRRRRRSTRSSRPGCSS